MFDKVKTYLLESIVKRAVPRAIAGLVVLAGAHHVPDLLAHFGITVDWAKFQLEITGAALLAADVALRHLKGTVKPSTGAAKGILLGLILLASPALAEDSTQGIYLSMGKLNLTVPFKNVSAVALWDFIEARGLVGAETLLATYPVPFYKQYGLSLNLTGGAVTTIGLEGAPLIGGHIGIENPPASMEFLKQVEAGGYGAYDFHGQGWMAGLKAAYKFAGSLF